MKANIPGVLKPNEYEVGDKVAIFKDSDVYGTVESGTVINVTKTGRYSIEVEQHGRKFKRAFMPSGREVGGNIWHNNYYLVPKAEQQEREAVYTVLKARSDAAQRIHATLHALQQYHIRPETIRDFKAELVKLHQYTNAFIDTLED